MQALACPKCQQPMTVPPAAAGRTVQCPRCGQGVQAPGVVPSPAPAPPRRDDGLYVRLVWALALAWMLLAFLVALVNGIGYGGAPDAPVWALANVVFAASVAVAVEKLLRA